VKLLPSLLAAATMVLAQTPIAQAPIKIPFTCTPEDVEAFGLTCSPEEPCPVFLELSAVESLGGRIFLTGNLHTGTTTMFSVLLLSDDGGKTFAEPHPRLKWGALEQIQFADLEYGWISGQFNQPLPRDPFLLITTDGGKTWSQRPLFDDSHFGSIQQFWFTSRNDGQLIVDRDQGGRTRHQLLETKTGGSAWDPKEVSDKPIALKRTREPSQAVWRVRAEADSKTYRVERRTSESWESVASIVIHAGDCQ
jgi:hypothetical protein